MPVYPDDPRDAVRWVGLSADKWAGPFRAKGYVLSDDYEDLALELGISRALYDDIMAWNEDLRRPGKASDWEHAHHATKQDLLRRLVDEVHPGIEVEEQFPHLPVRVALRQWEQGVEQLLPPLPVDLQDRITVWLGEAARHDPLGLGPPAETDEVLRAFYDWEYRGDLIARDVRALVGPGYVVWALHT